MPLRKRVRLRVTGALMLIEPDDRFAPESSADSLGPRANGSPDSPLLIKIDVETLAASDGPLRLRLVLARSELEYVARLRDLRPVGSSNAGHAEQPPLVPQLLRVGSVSIVSMVDVARACGIATTVDPPSSVARARAFLHERIHDVVRVSDLSRATGVHRVHLSREFRRWFQVPMMTYLYDLRVENAVHALATTTHSLARIAAANGFADHGHLTRRFAARLGIVPSELRALMRLRVDRPLAS